MRDRYQNWLQDNFEGATVKTQLAQARRLEKAFGDLDEQFDRDQFASILGDLAYTAADKKAGKPKPTIVPIDSENVYEALRNV